MARNTEKKIGELLLEQGYINPHQLQEALEEQKTTGEKVGEVLIRKGWLVPEELNRALALQLGVSTFDLANYIVNPQVIETIPQDIAVKYKVIPVFKVGDTLTVAMIDPGNVFLVDELQRITNCQVEAVLADEMTIRKAQDQYYGGAGTIHDIIASIDKNQLKEAEKLGDEAPVVKLVNLFIVEAVQVNTSDIHFEPEEKFMNVRYRIDGMLQKHAIIPKDLQPAIISRIKIMSGMDIAEKRLPQDGRILKKIGNKDIDFRVSSCPTIHGENIVLRILDKSSMALGMESLGFPKKELAVFEEIISQPYGIVLVTGPTGSGKTTTLYSALMKINREDINIMTVEDPVEYQFPQIRQVHVNHKAGLTFASALRSFLRQDPDVIMVGEIRDVETAQIAVQAALTGHLVLSTLHTNDSPTAFSRLIDMGVEPFLVSSAILGVLAQRLVRQVCSKCKELYLPQESLLKALGLRGKVDPDVKFARGNGCKLCNGSGYKGRIGIYELLKVTPQIEEVVLRSASADEIREVAKKQGMRTLREAAIDRLLAGETSPEEVMRITQTIN
ncbi:MAG: Flp pilus assembly complex ATPase component TadA [Candidatus Omnitrophica bacterium]|nr:Flp pilus assembly complex ATPase component TadA [Candidatus Omnitrophota bacterium]